MQNSTFPNQVKKHFDFLIREEGFHIVSEEYTGFPLAEWIVKLCSKEICIQVSIDKSQVFIDIGLSIKAVKWFDLMYLLQYLTQDFKWKYYWSTGEINEGFYDSQLRHLSKIIKENYDQIKESVIRISHSKSEEKRFQQFINKHSK